eukprot:TRINITY_DN21246_c0_g1_i1.p1 TRINITY_DN21246_c0_g1~~TRINITY_DN21246_c0_g1_i1.p1  ORF type:complete len:351 (-),score=25.90 TRINITY_DN21246_c0_g1_i1:177-1229(-)
MVLRQLNRLLCLTLKGRVGNGYTSWMKHVFKQQTRGYYQEGVQLPYFELHRKISWKNLVIAPALPYYVMFLGGIPCLIFCPPFARIIMSRIPDYPKILVEKAGKIQMTYLALIMTFVGSVNWGVAMADAKDLAAFNSWKNRLRMLLAVIPMMTTIPMSQLMHIGPCSLLFAIFLGSQWTLDIWMLERLMIPPWYCQLRGPIAFWATCCSTLTWADCAGEAMTRGTQKKKGYWNLNLWDPRGSFKNPMFDIPNEEKIQNAREYFELLERVEKKRLEREQEREASLPHEKQHTQQDEISEPKLKQPSSQIKQRHSQQSSLQQTVDFNNLQVESKGLKEVTQQRIVQQQSDSK